MFCTGHHLKIKSVCDWTGGPEEFSSGASTAARVIVVNRYTAPAIALSVAITTVISGLLSTCKRIVALPDKIVLTDYCLYFPMPYAGPVTLFLQPLTSLQAPVSDNPFKSAHKWLSPIFKLCFSENHSCKQRKNITQANNSAPSELNPPLADMTSTWRQVRSCQQNNVITL